MKLISFERLFPGLFRYISNVLITIHLMNSFQKNDARSENTVEELRELYTQEVEKCSTIKKQLNETRQQLKGIQGYLSLDKFSVLI